MGMLPCSGHADAGRYDHVGQCLSPRDTADGDESRAFGSLVLVLVNVANLSKKPCLLSQSDKVPELFPPKNSDTELCTLSKLCLEMASRVKAGVCHRSYECLFRC